MAQRRIEYRFQTLTKFKDGKLKAPMSPGLAMNEFCEKMGMNYRLLFRVWFEDPDVLQNLEGKNEKTGYDHLFGVELFHHEKSGKEIRHIFLIIDEGAEILPVGAMFTDHPALVVTPAYKMAGFIKKLTSDELEAMFLELNEFVTKILNQRKDKK